MVLGLDGPFAAGSHSQVGRLNDEPPQLHAPSKSAFRSRGSLTQNRGRWPPSRISRNHAERALRVKGGDQHLGFGRRLGRGEVIMEQHVRT